MAGEFHDFDNLRRKPGDKSADKYYASEQKSVFGSPGVPRKKDPEHPADMKSADKYYAQPKDRAAGRQRAGGGFSTVRLRSREGLPEFLEQLSRNPDAAYVVVTPEEKLAARVRAAVDAMVSQGRLTAEQAAAVQVRVEAGPEQRTPALLQPPTPASEVSVDDREAAELEALMSGRDEERHVDTSADTEVREQVVEDVCSGGRADGESDEDRRAREELEAEEAILAGDDHKPEEKPAESGRGRRKNRGS